MCFGIALTGLVVHGDRHFDTGRHIWDVPPSEAVGNRLEVWIEEWLYVMATCCVKISVLLFYRRLSGNITNTFLATTYVGILYNVLYLGGFLLVLVLICTPLDAYWRSFSPEWLSHAAAHPFKCGDEGQSREPVRCIVGGRRCLRRSGGTFPANRPSADRNSDMYTLFTSDHLQRSTIIPGMNAPHIDISSRPASCLFLDLFSRQRRHR